MAIGEHQCASLMMIDGLTPGRIIPLDDRPLLIGRGSDCDLVLRDDHKGVSGRHARIVREADGSFFLEDLRSLNRTEVDGRMLQGQRIGLRHGSRIRITHYHFVFRQGQDDSSTIRYVADTSATRSSDSLKVRSEEKLRGLLEICQALGSARDPQDIGRNVLDRLFTIFPQADQGLMVLCSGDEIEPISRRRVGSQSEVHFSRTILRRVLEEGKAILCEDIEGVFGKTESIAASEIFMLMCAPLCDFERRPIGMIQIDTSRRRGRFTQEDLDLLMAVAGPVGTLLENARLQRLAAEVQQAERDARELQQALLPLRRPELPGYTFWDHYEPAEFVGGDYFDYLADPSQNRGRGPQDGTRWVVVVADVAGKRMAAAKQMARVSTILRHALLTEGNPAQVVGLVNRELCLLGEDERYVTLLLGVIDPQTHTLTIVRAGHPAPLIRRRDGRVQQLAADCNGMVLGFDPGSSYVEASVQLDPGDEVVFFSDGITEAMDDESHWFGDQRLDAALRGARLGVAEVGQSILGAVCDFVRGHPQSDDITLLCFGRAPS